jgi:translation elongation factor EF-G
MAFEAAVKKADPIVLEPVMRVEAVVPREHLADVIGNLSARRGLIESHEDRGDTQVVRARVPMSELFAYAVDLRERTRGRAIHSIYFVRYQELRDRPDIDDDDRAASVRAPRTPPPTVNDFGVALPEPDDDLET